MILQVDKEVDYTENQMISPYGLLQVGKDITTGTIDVVLANDPDNTRTFDLEKTDVNALNLLVIRVMDTGSIDNANVRVFQ